MRTIAFTVRVEMFGERHRAIVAQGDGLAGEPLSVVVREDPHAAVLVALEQAAHSIADQMMTRR